jgi:tripartite-type tricarboxylate transporter receptor subunit TctC
LKRLPIFASALLLTLAAAAQEPPFPQKGNVELTVLFPAGSSADVTARLLAEKPDGYSLVWNSNSISTTYYSGLLPFDYKAFDPVARVLVESPVLAVRAEAPWKSLGEFLADAKAHPGKLTVGNSGVGSHTHISSVALFRAAGVEVIDVPYAAAQVVPSLLGGQIDAVVQLPGALAAHVTAGKLRLLAALIPQRDPALPNVPTAIEQGVNVSLEAWRGVAVPHGTPAQVLAALETSIRKTVEAPEFARACDQLGVRPAFLPGAQFGALIAKEDAQLATLMQEIGLRKP